jgi:hypothetical protein
MNVFVLPQLLWKTISSHIYFHLVILLLFTTAKYKATLPARVIWRKIGYYITPHQTFNVLNFYIKAHILSNYIFSFLYLFFSIGCTLVYVGPPSWLFCRNQYNFNES